MSRIQVTPERLFEAAREVEDAREQMEDTREELVRLIRWMESMWSGMVRERFLERFEENQPRMIDTLESLAHIAKELREIGVRFQQADEVSGAAVAGNVATMSIGLKATQSNDDKGYQMKYDTYLRIWLPVNENGVTDQAALQAYERDHGKIDVTKMGQPPGANPVPEQDLIQLQIEAFELGVNPFTGEPVTDDYAKMMISSLKWSQIVAGIGMVTGSMKSGKGPYKGRGTSASAALDKVKQIIRDAKAKREQAGKIGKGTGNVAPRVPYSKEVEIADKQGNPLGEIDEIDLVNKIFHEDKSAEGLSVINPKTGKPFQTAEKWANKQIYAKTKERILNLQKVDHTRSTKNGSIEIPTLDEIKDVRRFNFRMNASTPELREAVQKVMDKLKKEFPDYTFSAEFGRGGS